MSDRSRTRAILADAIAAALGIPLEPQCMRDLNLDWDDIERLLEPS